MTEDVWMACLVFARHRTQLSIALPNKIQREKRGRRTRQPFSRSLCVLILFKGCSQQIPTGAFRATPHYCADLCVFLPFLAGAFFRLIYQKFCSIDHVVDFRFVVRKRAIYAFEQIVWPYSLSENIYLSLRRCTVVQAVMWLTFYDNPIFSTPPCALFPLLESTITKRACRAAINAVVQAVGISTWTLSPRLLASLLRPAPSLLRKFD